MFNVKRGSIVTSQSKDENGNPLFVFNGGKVNVRSMEELANFLQVAKEKRLNETRLCLEGLYSSWVTSKHNLIN